jgi:hypothetical protein
MPRMAFAPGSGRRRGPTFTRDRLLWSSECGICCVCQLVGVFVGPHSFHSLHGMGVSSAECFEVSQHEWQSVWKHQHFLIAGLWLFHWQSAWQLREGHTDFTGLGNVVWPFLYIYIYIYIHMYV